jgi:hypothetical protein
MQPLDKDSFADGKAPAPMDLSTHAAVQSPRADKVDKAPITGPLVKGRIPDAKDPSADQVLKDLITDSLIQDVVSEWISNIQLPQTPLPLAIADILSSLPPSCVHTRIFMLVWLCPTIRGKKLGLS